MATNFIRHCTRALAGFAAAATVSAAIAADWPADTVHIVVPWRAGGGTDLIARGIGAALEKQTGGKAVVVDNITSGAGNAAHMAVKDAAPDGLTMLLNGSSDLNTPVIFRDTPYKLEDFACVGGVYSTPTWVLANAEQGFGDLGDFIKKAREKPGVLTVGVGSFISAHYVMAKAIAGRNDLNVRFIPFDGGGPLLKAILANQVTIGVIHSPILLNEIKAGKVDVLATGGDLSGINYPPVRSTKHIKEWNTPTDIGVIRGLFVPKSTPPEILAQAEAALEKAAKSEEFATFADKFGFAPIWMNSREYCAFMQKENAEYRQIKKEFIDPK
ncbi:MAG: tripartite tricarboxylate transporter substrate binding protein [Burkholderiaceae bacterium]